MKKLSKESSNKKTSKQGKSSIKYKAVYLDSSIWVYGEANKYCDTMAETKKWIKDTVKKHPLTRHSYVYIQKVTKTWNYLNDQFIEEEIE